MSKAFKTLKTKYELTDFITFGKYDGCRVDSVIQTDPGYISWLIAKTTHKFTQPVHDALGQELSRRQRERHQAEEEDPYLKDDYACAPYTLSGWDDDIPF